jgi:cytochrome P450
MTTPVQALDFDHHSARTTNDREQVLAELSQHPIFWTNSHDGYWVVTSHALAREVLRNAAVFSSHKNDDMTGGPTIPTTPGPRLLPVETDAPYHRKFLKVLTPRFTRGAVERLRPWLEEFVADVIDRAVQMREFDIVHDIAEQIPAGAMVKYLGFPDEDRISFIQSAHAMLPASERPYAPDPKFGFDYSVGLIKALIAQRRAEPADDLMSHLISPEFDLDDEEVLWLTFTILTGSSQSPVAFLGNSLLYLAQNPDLRDRLVADPGLIPAAGEELLRQTSSATGVARTVLEDITLGGVQVRKGDRLLVWLPSVNWDPAVFEHPEKADIDRPACPHMAFGLGAHLCTGAALIRTMFEVMMREVLTKMPNYEVDTTGQLRFEDSSTMWGWRDLPARILG